MAENTAAESARFARDVRIEKIELWSHSATQAEMVDIRYMVEEITVFEALFEPKISGHMLIRDSQNMISNIPIVGQEKLVLKWKTAGFDEWVEKEFLVYKVGERLYHRDHTQTYTIFFVSNEYKQNITTAISQSYSGLISDIVAKVFNQDNYIKTTKKIDIETTKYQQKIVVPFWKPFQLCTWLSTRAISADTNSPSYVFCETLDGFVFRSIGSMLAKAPKIEYIVRQANLKWHPESDEEWKDVYRSVEYYGVESSLDTITNFSLGGFSGSLTQYDVISKKAKTTTYDYLTDASQTPHLYGNLMINETDKFGDSYKNKNLAYRNFMAVHTKHYDDVLSYYPHEWRLQRQAYIQQLMTVPVAVTVAGDSRRRCGDIVEFTFPSAEPTEDGKTKSDLYLTGKYVVTAIRHNIRHDDYRMQLSLHKDSLFSKLRNADVAKLVEEKQIEDTLPTPTLTA